MDIIKERFIKQFGDKDAENIINAALEHADGINSGIKGSSLFRWAITICLGFDCFITYREYHKITASWEEIDRWIMDYAELEKHDGDVDYRSAFCGVYDKYMLKEDK